MKTRKLHRKSRQLTLAVASLAECLERRMLLAVAVPYGGNAAVIDADPGNVSVVEAEKYDDVSPAGNGEGIAYHDDDSANQGGAFRTNQGVDVGSSASASNGY